MKNHLIREVCRIASIHLSRKVHSMIVANIHLREKVQTMKATKVHIYLDRMDSKNRKID